MTACEHFERVCTAVTSDAKSFHHVYTAALRPNRSREPRERRISDGTGAALTSL